MPGRCATSGAGGALAIVCWFERKGLRDGAALPRSFSALATAAGRTGRGGVGISGKRSVCEHRGVVSALASLLLKPVGENKRTSLAASAGGEAGARRATRAFAPTATRWNRGELRAAMHAFSATPKLS